MTAHGDISVPAVPPSSPGLESLRYFRGFAQPTPFTFGTGTRTYPDVRGPKIRRLDLLISRLQKVGTSTVEVRVEAQNVLNLPQFGEPVGTLTDGNFGKIITGGGERKLQLGVRFGF